MMSQSCSEENFSIETAGLVVFNGLSVFSEETVLHEMPSNAFGHILELSDIP